MAYQLPTQAERPVLFRWLKQQSSCTVWKKIERYFDDWVEEAKRIQPLAHTVEPYETTPSRALRDSNIQLMLNCRASFVDAVARLKAGDKSTFKWLGYGSGKGYFCEALRTVDAWQTAIDRAMSGEELPLMDTPYWPRFDQRFKALSLAVRNGGYALEERHTDVPARLADMTSLRGTYTVLAGDKLPTPNPTYEAVRLIAASLPPIPTQREEIVIKTGDSTPCYGIWEPVKLDLTAGFIGMFKRPLIPADGRFELDGCMNYLHAGSPAPTIGFEEDDLRGEGRPTVWRLLWRDDRYQDGLIPDEEAEYVFIESDVPLASKASNATIGELVVAASGTPAPLAGTWASKTELNVRVRVELHALLPQHEGRDIEWVHVPLV